MSIKESALNTITALTNSDFVRMVTSAGASRKATLQSIAQHIIENYAGSSLAGKNQSVKSALDELNGTLEIDDFTVSVTFGTAPTFSHFVKQGNILHITYQGASGISHVSDEVLFTLPDGYRPIKKQYFIGAIGQTACVIQCALNGVCTIYSNPSSTAGRLYLDATFFV